MAPLDRRMGTRLLFILIHLITGGEGCNDTVSMLSNLHRRGRTNIEPVVHSVPYVDDLYNLNDGWYTSTRENITYVMVTNATLPLYYTCGNLYGSIYMLGNAPDTTTLTDGEEKDVVACVQTSFNPCDDQYDIKIRNCGGELQYYLKTANINAAYCFDPPEIAALSSAPTDVSLGNITVTPGLRFRKEVKTASSAENYYPSLVFECTFKSQADYYYQVEWSYNNIPFITLGPTDTITELILTESVIQEHGITLGVTFRCGVSVSVDQLGLRTQVKYSSGLFAGIVFNNSTMKISKTSDAVITFKLTVPIGCRYNAFAEVDFCTHDLHMFDRQYNCSAQKGTIQSEVTKNYPRRCGAHITTLKANSTFNPDKEYTFRIVTKDETYADRNTFIQEFVTAAQPDIGLWNNYSPHDVTIIVVDQDIARVEYCYTHVDPHYKTTDSSNYDQHAEGDFMLYRNKKYDIVVQERTRSCTVNAVTCTCAVAVRAGADIVLFDTCNDKRVIGFKECGDNGILRTKQITDELYEVHTPIGTYVQVALLTGYFDGMMNVDIFMSPKDFNNTEGLCGSFDNNKHNDFKTREGLVLSNNANEIFSNSWRLNETENYLGFRYGTLNRWSQENDMFCFCEEDRSSNKTGTDYTTCSASQYEGCHVVDVEEVTGKLCTFASNRNKRSVSNHYDELKRWSSAPYHQKRQHRTIKKSIVKITETEATETCTNVLSNSLVATDFTGFMAPGEVEAKISQCIFDVLALNDMSVATIHFDSLNGLVTFNMDKDTDYVENNTEQVQLFKQQSCPRNCSGQGQCVDGICDCAIHLHGAACAIDERDPLTIDDISGGGLCDSSSSECTCFTISTRNLIDPFTLRYNMSHLSSDGQYIPLGTTRESGQYMSMFAGLVCVPEPTRTDTYVRHYKIAISNDGYTFSIPVEMHVYDSTCQQYMLDSYGTYTFLLKSGYCRIDGRCYRHNDKSVNNACNYCNTIANNTTWTPGCTEKPGSDNYLVLIVTIICVTIVIGFVAVVVVVYGIKTANRRLTNSKPITPNSATSGGDDDGGGEIPNRPITPNIAASGVDDDGEIPNKLRRPSIEVSDGGVDMQFQMSSRQNSAASAVDGRQGLYSSDETSLVDSIFSKVSDRGQYHGSMHPPVPATIEENEIAVDNERAVKRKRHKHRHVENTSLCINTPLDDTTFSKASDRERKHGSMHPPVTETIAENEIAADNERAVKRKRHKHRHVENTSTCINTPLDDTTFSKASDRERKHGSMHPPVTETIAENEIAADNERVVKRKRHKHRHVENKSKCDNTPLDDSTVSKPSDRERKNDSMPLPIPETIGEIGIAVDNEAIGPARTHSTQTDTTKQAKTTDQSNQKSDKKRKKALKRLRKQAKLIQFNQSTERT